MPLRMQVFVIINNVAMMINADGDIKNQLIKEIVMKDLFGILVIVNMNVKNYLILDSIQVMKVLSVEENWLTNWLKNLLKILMKRNQLR